MKFGYTILYVKSVKEALAFYEKAFGLKTKMLHETGQYGELDTGETTLAFGSSLLASLNGFKADAPSEDPTFEIAFVTEDVEAAYQTAIAAGAVELKKPSKKPWGQTVGYVRDPNGFLVEIASPM
jgi:uncharacterized glyoxalase superfamily protein PhnB